MDDIRRMFNIMAILLVMVVACVFIARLFPVDTTISLETIPNMTLSSTDKIKAVNDKTNVSGTFRGNLYYTTGKIESEDVYKLFVEQSGYLETVTIPAKVTRLVGITTGEPRLETYTEKRESFLGINSTTVTGYILYVPEASIVSDFTLDLEG